MRSRRSWFQAAISVTNGGRAARSWQLVVSSVLVFCCYFIIWPLSDFASMTWREHALDVIWGVIVAHLFTADEKITPSGGPLDPGATITFGYQASKRTGGVVRPASCRVDGVECRVTVMRSRR